MGHGFKGTKEIDAQALTAIQFKEAGLMINGYIQFVFGGSRESKGGAFDSAKDENSVMFNRNQEQRFRRLKEIVDKARRSSPVNNASTGGVSREVGELERLAALFERGLLTEEEFQAKKRQILGL